MMPRNKRTYCKICAKAVKDYFRKGYATHSFPRNASPFEKKVAVIGTGVSGISALSNLTSPYGNIKPVAFERSGTFGGHWSFTGDDTVDKFGYPPSSAIYCGLRTNLPKQLMSFPDFDHDVNLPTFPQQSDIFDYLRRFVDQNDLEKYIKYNTIVTNVVPSSPGEEMTKWEVTWKHVTNSATSNTEEFDTVLICNGNCVFPNIPPFPGMEDFQGRLIHSRDYRRANEFRDQTVAVIGSSYSGKDVARQLSETAKKVYLTHIDQPLKTVYANGRVVEKNYGISSLKESSMVLENGEEIHLDAMVMCTGYKYKFPFLSEEILSTDGEHVTPLFKHVLHLHYRSLMVISVLRNVALYPTSFNQARFARAVIDGVADIPSKAEMKEDISREIEYRTENNLVGPFWHYMDTLQWQYDRDLAKLGKFEPISEVLHTYWDFVESHREKDFCNYWKYDYVLKDNKTIEAVKRTEYLEDPEAEERVAL